LESVLVKEVVLLRSELRDCLAHVQSILVRAEDALGKLQVVPSLPELQVGSFKRVDVCAASEHEYSVVADDEVVDEMMSKTEAPEESFVGGEDYIFGCYSPRDRPCPLSQPAMSVASVSEDIDVIMAPVMHIMPELQELCGEASPSHVSTVELQVDSLGAPTMAPTAPPVDLGKLVDFVDLDGKVNEAADLAPNSEALFVKELLSLLVRLEVAIPGSGKEIASLLSEKATMDKVKKVKEYLRSKSKINDAARKAPTAG
jgi:hypothetical protein